MTLRSGSLPDRLGFLSAAATPKSVSAKRIAMQADGSATKFVGLLPSDISVIVGHRKRSNDATHFGDRQLLPRRQAHLPYCRPIRSLRGYISNRLVNDLHLFFIHPAAVHRDSRERGFDLAKVSRRKLNIDCAQVLVQVIDVACAWDRNDPRLLSQKPRKGNLRRRCVLPICEPLAQLRRSACSLPGSRD